MNKNTTIADLVRENIKTADVFKKYNIDFCCGGGMTLSKACAKKNVDLQQLMDAIESLDKHLLPSQNFNNWGLDFLVDYIVQTHHKYVNDALGILMAYSEKVSKVHGEGFPEVLQIQRLLKILQADLLMHMQKEEHILFPYIKRLVASEKSMEGMPEFQLGTIEAPISKMREEHELAGDLLKEMALLSSNFDPPKEACNTFKALYAKLKEFEEDLHIHVHLENNILFPKAMELESGLALLKVLK